MRINAIQDALAPYRLGSVFDVNTGKFYTTNDMEIRERMNNAARLDEPRYKRLAVNGDWTLALQTAINENSSVDINIPISIKQVDLVRKEGFWLYSSNRSQVTLLTNPGALQQAAIRLIDRCIDVTIEGIRFIGTGTTQPLYSDLEINCGIKVDDRAIFTVIQNCSFTKFVSFGIWAKDLGYAPSRRGVNIINCQFFEWQVDLTAQNQAAVLFGNGGEYCNVMLCQGTKIPAFVRMFGGANCTVADNMVWECNGALQTGAASLTKGIIFCTPGDNNGKMIIRGNHINHNDCNIWPLLLIGDVTKPQNPFTIVDNDLLANGTATFCGSIKIIDSPDTLIRGNSMRAADPTATSTLLEVSGVSTNVMVTENDFRKGGKSIDVIAGSTASVNAAMNRYAEYLSADRYSGLIREDRGWATEITGATGATTFNELMASQTVARSAAGTYVITHNFGDVNYSCAMFIDAGSAPAAAWTVTCYKQANTVTIYVKAGVTLTDPVKLSTVLRRY